MIDSDKLELFKELTTEMQNISFQLKRIADSLDIMKKDKRI